MIKSSKSFSRVILLAVAWSALWARLGFGEEAGAASEEASEKVSEEPSELSGLPVMSKGELRFFIDTAGFRGPEGRSRYEIYILIDAKQLWFVSEGEYSLGRMELTIGLTDMAGTPVEDWTLTRSVSVDSLDILVQASAPFRDVIGFDLLPGTYRTTLTIKDSGSGKIGVCETVVEARDFENQGLIFSDIQFASEVARSGEVDRFVKQGWKVTPNVSRHFLSGKPLSVYFELYNFSSEFELIEDSFILGYSLVDSSGQKVREYPAKRILKPGESCVKTDVLETEGLPAGRYDFQIEAFDGGSREYLRARRPVFLAIQEQVEPFTQVQRNLLRYYTDIRYIADEKTLKAYKFLQDWPTKAKFLRHFWKNSDPTPGTVTNERLLEHMLRMNHTENRFVERRRKRGSDTDKGRVYIKYGPPDEIDYHTSAAGQKPYEAWLYEQKGDYQFIFRDRRGSGIYELVHSTYPGEVYNPYWRSDF